MHQAGVSDNDGTGLPSPMAPAAGRGGVASGVESCRTGGEAGERARGLDEGFLKGRLGRARFGGNERYMAAAVNVIF